MRSGAKRKDYPHAEFVKNCLVQGNIVPVELSLGLLRIAMDEKAAEVASSSEDEEGYGSRIFLVDGFPRNYDNLRGWMERMPSYAAVLGALVYDCPMEVLERRILSRAETSGRSDDNLDSARRRFETFRKQTEPVVMALERVGELQAEKNGGRSQLRVVNIDATGTVDEVWKETESAMDLYVRNDVLTANANLLKAVEGGDAEKFADFCDDRMTLEDDSEIGIDEIFEKYERPMNDYATAVSNAQVEIVDGIKAVVSYDRKIREDRSNEIRSVREFREWRHGPKGWRCVHFSRQDLD